MPYALCRMPYATNTERHVGPPLRHRRHTHTRTDALCLMPYAVCLMPQILSDTWVRLYATAGTRTLTHSYTHTHTQLQRVCLMPYALGLMPDALCLMPDA
jgi:hypothetical protein